MSEKTLMEKGKSFLTENLYGIIVGILTIVYIVRSLIGIEKSGKTVEEILADAAISFIIGFAISKLLASQGMKDGLNKDNVVKTIMLHGDKVGKITPYINYLDAFCEEKNEKIKVREQTRILAGENIRYQDFVNEFYAVRERGEFVYKEFHELPKKKQRAINKAKRLKLSILASSSLTTEGSKATDPFNFGQTTKQFMIKRDGSQIVSKFFMALIFGYFGVTLLKDSALENVIWAIVQMGSFLAVGMLAYIKSFMFITVDYRKGIIQKIDLIDEFMAWLKDNHSILVEQEKKAEQEYINNKELENGNKQESEQTETTTVITAR